MESSATAHILKRKKKIKATILTLENPEISTMLYHNSKLTKEKYLNSATSNTEGAKLGNKMKWKLCFLPVLKWWKLKMKTLSRFPAQNFIHWKVQKILLQCSNSQTTPCTLKHNKSTNKKGTPAIIGATSFSMHFLTLFLIACSS